MKKAVILLAVSIVYIVSFSQETDSNRPLGWKFLKEKKQISTYNLPFVDVESLKEEDKINDKLPMPWRFGFKHNVSYGLLDGSWDNLDDGGRIWRIKFKADQALSLNVVFDEFYMPNKSILYIYNEEHTELLGAYTSEQNQDSEKFGTWLLEADNIIIEYYEPKGVEEEVKLHIGAITHGYRSAKSFKTEKALNSSGDCNLDVECSIGSDWDPIKDVNKKSVGILLSGGAGFCSGALVNNTANDGKPYFLTANHCYSNPATWAFRFEWISPNTICATSTPSQNGPTTKTISGATLRAKNAATDFCLVEINSAIPTVWDLTWAGWDKTDNYPTYVVGVHHPRGDVMKVCRDDSGPNKSSANGEPVWQITSAGGGWELGVTEGGSSGSPLFDQDGRIVGQLWRGGASCNGTVDNNLYDEYGRFGVSWDGSSSSERLRDWLDPTNSNVNTISSYPPLQVYSLDASVLVSFPEEVCAQTTTNATITLKNNGSTNLTSATITWSLNSGTNTVINWIGNLAQNQTEDIQLGNLSSSTGVFTISASTASPNGGVDELTTNDVATNTMTLSSNRFGTTKVYLDLLTDNYSDETTWEFRTANGTVIQTGGPYNTDNVHFLDSFNVVSNECYEFEIFDSEEDGICCSYGNGSYELRIDNSTLIAEGGNFNESELVEFSVVGTTTVLELENDGVLVFPNPMNEKLNIQLNSYSGNYKYVLLNSVGQEVLTGDLKESVNLVLPSLSKGVYFVKIFSDNGITIVRKIIKK